MENEEVKTTAEAAPQENEATAQAAAPQEVAAPAEPKAIDSFREYMHTNFPESNYDEDEDAIYRDAMSRVESLEGDSKTLKNLTEKLNARLSKNPAEAEAVLDWLDGEDIRVAIARHMGSDALAVPEEGSRISVKQAKQSRKRLTTLRLTWTSIVPMQSRVKQTSRLLQKRMVWMQNRPQSWRNTSLMNSSQQSTPASSVRTSTSP